MHKNAINGNSELKLSRLEKSERKHIKITFRRNVLTNRNENKI